MGLGSFLFGRGGGFESFYNPYIEQLNNAQLSDYRGPRQYYKSIMQSYKTGDYGKMPGMGMFDNELAKQNRTIDETANPLAYTAAGEAGGPLADRVRELRKQQAAEGINGQRFGFVQNQLGQAAQGLTDIASRRNQETLDRLKSAAGLFNGTFQYRQPQTGALSGVISGLAGGFGSGYGSRLGGGSNNQGG